MADKITPGGGGGFLKKSSSGVLKRSSSVEILTSVTPRNPITVAPAGNTKVPAKAAPTEQAAATPATPAQQGSTPARVRPPLLPSSASSQSFDGVLQERPPEGGISPIKNLSSASLTGLEDKGPLKTSTPLKDSQQPKGEITTTAVVKPIAEGGHIFKVTTKPPDEVALAAAAAKTPSSPQPKAEGSPEVNPLVKRRKRKEAVTAVPSQGEKENEESQEPIWQKRLSQLFVPPSERELQKEAEEQQVPKSTEPEETSQLLPKSSPKPHKKRSSEEKRNVALLNELNKGATPNNRKESRGEEEKEKAKKKKQKEDEEKKEEEEEREKKRQNQKKEETPPRSNNRINFHEDVLNKKEKKKKKTKWDDEDDYNEDGEEDRLTALERLERQGNEDDSDDFDTTSSDDEEDDEDDEEDVFRDGYTSWDDTICSNRSSYFKMYYSQRGVIGPNRSDDNKSKASRASSHNSLSSLIRERMGRPQLPTVKKTRADLGLMILVAVLFIIIVVGISLTSYFYNLHLMEMTIFNSIKFIEKSRELQILNADWQPVATAHLGCNLPSESAPEDCTHYLHYLHKHNHTMPNDGTDATSYEDFVCLDWTSLARLQLRKLHPEGDIQCYSIWWVAGKQEFTLRDCLQIGGEYGAWWGGGEMSDGGYPVTNADVPPSPMVTGKLGVDSWGKLLRRTWMSDRASLLTLPDSFQGHVSVNHNSNNQVCVESRPHPHLKSPTPRLEYTLCTAPDLKTLNRFMHQKAVSSRKIVVKFSKGMIDHNLDEESHGEANESLDHNVAYEGSQDLSEVFGEDVKNRVKERINQPVWVPWMTPDKPKLTQDAVLKYVENIISHDYGNWGHILLPPSWQPRPGELSFDTKRFPDPGAMVNALEKKGFRLALSIHPYVSVNAPAFTNGTQAGIWVRQSKSQLPALAQYNSIHPSAITDFSNPRAKEWFSSRLKILKDTYKIDRYHLQPADAHALPAFHEYHLPLPGPDSALVHFMASVSAISVPMSSEGAIMPPLPPTFLTLGFADGSWKGLETLIPRMLTLTTLGYPLIDIGVIGGLAEPGHVPERELYIRWMEAATFMPSFQVSVLPHMYGEEMKTLVLEYDKMRKDVVLPRLHEGVTDAIEKGIPLVKTLAMFDPTDVEAAGVGDQWMLGRDLLVAPVIRRGERSRDVYLPEGIWEHGIDKHLSRGGQWIRNYKVPLTKIPHFILKSISDFNS